MSKSTFHKERDGKDYGPETDTRRMRADGILNTDELAGLVQRLVEGLRSGRITFRRGNESMEFDASGPVRTQCSVSEKSGKRKIEIEFTWKDEIDSPNVFDLDVVGETFRADLESPAPEAPYPRDRIRRRPPRSDRMEAFEEKGPAEPTEFQQREGAAFSTGTYAGEPHGVDGSEYPAAPSNGERRNAARVTDSRASGPTAWVESAVHSVPGATEQVGPGIFPRHEKIPCAYRRVFDKGPECHYDDPNIHHHENGPPARRANEWWPNQPNEFLEFQVNHSASLIEQIGRDALPRLETIPGAYAKVFGNKKRKYDRTTPTGRERPEEFQAKFTGEFSPPSPREESIRGLLSHPRSEVRGAEPHGERAAYAGDKAHRQEYLH
jgi:amphi-Trp domain-containing protein